MVFSKNKNEYDKNVIQFHGLFPQLSSKICIVLRVLETT